MASSPPQTDGVMSLSFHEQKPEEGDQLSLATASSSSSSSSRQMKYQVFLSFRGEDTRHTFTAQLHKTLKDTGINVFFDEVTLDKGEQLSPELSKAIAASTISIIILSKDYASSKSCLDELSHIMDRKDRQGQIVLPIFYHVDPSDVRNLGGSFKTSFEKHESERPFDELKVNRWKYAFADVGKLIGWHINGGKFDRSETEYIEDIAKTVIEKLNSKSRSVREGLVGIDDQKNTILRLIKKKENRVIGLWGMGGCGKTTLAEAVYNEISSEFQARSFVQNVREKCEKQGMESLRNDLVSKLLNSVTCIDTPSIGSTLIQQRLDNVRVLVVLDDVSDSDQILDMGIEHFGHGSKIIVTSRDKQELKNGGAHKIHKVEMLSKKDSLRLFSTHAFKQLNPAVEFLDLCYKFLKYAQGSPLALKVLGSLLYKKPRKVWESEVVKLNECAKPKISEVLKRCFDGLDELEKKIFLDVAIFFKGKRKEQVEAYLRGCYNESAVSGISRLLDKCLIEIVTIDDGYGELPYEEISMHDMLEEMGKLIELKDSVNRKRLWKAKDVEVLLRSNKWADSVEGIMLDVSEFDNRWLRSDVFQNMHSLRIIDLYGEKQHEVQVDIVYLPDEIKYLRWDDYPFKSLPSSFNPTNLIVLKLSGGDIEQLWNEDYDEDLVHLREIDVSGCTYLRKIPNLSRAINLKLLKCRDCESLVELASLDHLASLEKVDLTHCRSLMKIPNLSGALNLKVIDCSLCSSLVELASLDHLASLEEVDFTRCKSLRKIPNLSGTLNLKIIDCSGCLSLVELASLDHLASLEEVNLGRCRSLRKIPNLSGALNLKKFKCFGCSSLVDLPCLNHLASLEEVDLSYCTSLTKIPNISGALNLKSIRCTGCSRLVELPCLGHLTSLEEINLGDCKRLRKIPNLSGALNLKSIKCSGCSNLVELPCLNHLASLKELLLDHCYNLKKFPEVPNHLCKLDLSGSGIEQVPDSVENLVRLESLDISKSLVKKVSSNISKLESLHDLDLSFCPITQFPEVPRNLTESHLSGTQIAEQVSLSLDSLSGLRDLNNSSCSSIEKLQCNVGLPSLKEIQKLDVPSTTLMFKGLQVLRIRDCESLKLLSELPPYLRRLDARDCRSLENVSFTDQNLYQLDSLDDGDDDDEFVMFFNNCSKLNKDSVDNIETVALLKIGSLAQKWIREYDDFRKTKNFICCIRGNMISENKFEGHSESCSLILKLPPKPNGCSGGRFLAFSICLVADLMNLHHFTSFICNYQLTAAGGEEFKSVCQVDFKMRWEFEGDHVLILFSRDMITIDKDYEEASFQFYIKYTDFILEETGDKKYSKVKKCGIHVFYVDAE